MNERAKQILEHYAADIRGELEKGRPAPGTWIFRRGVDHETPLRAFVELLEEAREEGRREGAAAIAEQMDYQCACRCREHRKAACPFCLDVYGCPVHSEVDPSVLRPDFLKDPEAVANAIVGEARTRGCDLLFADFKGDIEGWTGFVEAVRRVVTVRMEAIRG